MKKYLVYKTIHLPTGKFYIGRHVTNNINDNYLGSGTRLLRMIKKYGRDQFKREIIKECKFHEDMILLEIQEIKKFLNHKNCLNLIIGDPLTSGIIICSEETKRNMSISRKRTHNTTEVKSKLSFNARNRSPELKAKMGLKHKGKTISSEMRAKQSFKLSGDKNPRALSWVIEYENNQPSEIITSLKTWCKDRNIKYISLYMKLRRNDNTFYNGIRVIKQ